MSFLSFSTFRHTFVDAVGLDLDFQTWRYGILGPFVLHWSMSGS